MRYRIILLAAALAVSGCGGSEDPIIRSSTFLPVYRYHIEQDRDSEDQLEFSVQWDGTRYVFSVRFSGSDGLTGLYDRSSGVTSIAPGSELTVETGDGAPLIGAFRAVVIEEIATLPTGEFSDGAWMIVAGNDTVRIDVASGISGVALSLNGGTAVSFEWPDFAELFAPGSAAPTWQQSASASFQFLRIAALQARTAFAVLVDATRVSFTDTPDVRSCSMFPGAPPPGVLNTGERVLTWLGAADLGFDLRFTDCWVDLAGEDQDYLYHGEIALTGWRSSGDGSNRLIFVGFGGDAFGNRVPGGVAYLDLAFSRTVPNSAGGSDFDPAADYTLSGGFAIGFVQP